MKISTGVVDCTHGRPASGIVVRLERRVDEIWQAAATGTTDQSGQISDWQRPADVFGRGVYRLVFDTAGYFTALGISTFHPEIVIAFVATEPSEDYHVPLLLGTHAYTTYHCRP